MASASTSLPQPVTKSEAIANGATIPMYDLVTFSLLPLGVSREIRSRPPIAVNFPGHHEPISDTYSE